MKIGIYPGSFDPITNGHLDIISRAKTLFDHVIIAVIQNPSKQAVFDIQERLNLIRALVGEDASIQVEGFAGLLVDYAKQKGVYTIIRGLRAVSDFEFEFQMALTNRQLCATLDTVFLMTEAKNSYLSSSLVKQVARLGGDVSSFVPEPIAKALMEKFSV